MRTETFGQCIILCDTMRITAGPRVIDIIVMYVTNSGLGGNEILHHGLDNLLAATTRLSLERLSKNRGMFCHKQKFGDLVDASWCT